MSRPSDPNRDERKDRSVEPVPAEGNVVRLTPRTKSSVAGESVCRRADAGEPDPGPSAA
ncbi:MAG: hypothetical protein RBS99_13575 [Rhodospirillales bacterium]|nr:hypothetical protein [Rhodospirillales bacterium]